MTRGATTLPIANCVTITTSATAIGLPSVPNCKNARRIGSAAATTEPTVGMKLSRNADIPQNTAKSTPNAARAMVITNPLRALTAVLATR